MEAALIYPIITLITAGLIVLFLTLFLSVRVECSLSRAAREAAGQVSETVYYGESRLERSQYGKANSAEVEECVEKAFVDRMNGFSSVMPELNVEYIPKIPYGQLNLYAIRRLDDNIMFKFGREKRHFCQWSVIDEAQWILNRDLFLGG